MSNVFICSVILTVFVWFPVLMQMDLLQCMVATPEVSPVCFPLSTRARPTIHVSLMGAVMDSSGVPPPLTMRQNRNILSVLRKMVSYFVVNIIRCELCDFVENLLKIATSEKLHCCYMGSISGILHIVPFFVFFI